MAIRMSRRAHRALQTILSTLGPDPTDIGFVSGRKSQRASQSDQCCSSRRQQKPASRASEASKQAIKQMQKQETDRTETRALIMRNENDTEARGETGKRVKVNYNVTTQEDWRSDERMSMRKRGEKPRGNQNSIQTS